MDSEENKIDFSSVLASSVHDMKNSIAMLIETMSEIVEKGVDESHPFHSNLLKMKYEANRVNNDLVQVLTLYKLGNDQYPLDISHYDACKFVDDQVFFNIPMLKFKNVEIETNCSCDKDETLMWFFDRALVSGVVDNVMYNLYRYTKDKIRLSIDTQDGYLVISIEDNGNGYPETMLFEGSQSKTGISFTSGSSSLGLYFASVVAKAHVNNGKEGYVSISNGGAYGGGCFQIFLP